MVDIYPSSIAIIIHLYKFVQKFPYYYCKIKVIKFYHWKISISFKEKHFNWQEIILLLNKANKLMLPLYNSTVLLRAESTILTILSTLFKLEAWKEHNKDYSSSVNTENCNNLFR